MPGGTSKAGLSTPSKAERRSTPPPPRPTTTSQIARSNVQDRLVSKTALVEAESTEELRANLELARKEAASNRGEARKFKELEEKVRNELHASRLALRESESKLAELNGVLATAEHEKALSNTAVKELRLESARLKRNMEALRSAPAGETMQELTDTLVSELKELRTQLAATVLERYVNVHICYIYPVANTLSSVLSTFRMRTTRFGLCLLFCQIVSVEVTQKGDKFLCIVSVGLVDSSPRKHAIDKLGVKQFSLHQCCRDGLNEDIGTLKQQLVTSEGVHKADRRMLDSSLASQQVSHALKHF